MALCGYEPYTLPTYEIVGGTYLKLTFYAYFHTEVNPYDLSNCEVNFAIIDFMNKEGQYLDSRPMSIEDGADLGDGDHVMNRLTVDIPSSVTKNLYGKYIYQISIKEATSKVEIPSQGILLIENNINKSYIS